MKGIILAGGSGTRLYPFTKVVSKQLLPVYDKPMIYYPLSMLMLAGIKDILIISTPTDTPRFKELLGDGAKYGINLSYKVQPSPDGLAQAFILGEEFIGKDNVCLILGDNIFYGHGMSKVLKDAVVKADEGKATLFGYYVNDPNRFGIVGFDDNGKVTSIVEKPEKGEEASNYAATGLYFYDNRVVDIAKHIKPSARRELEITTVNQKYLELGDLEVTLLGRGYTWLDTGTTDSLLEASQFVKIMQEHQGVVMSCLEEIAYKKGWISKEDILKQANLMKKNNYGKHLFNVIDNKIKY